MSDYKTWIVQQCLEHNVAVRRGNFCEDNGEILADIISPWFSFAFEEWDGGKTGRRVFWRISMVEKLEVGRFVR